MTSQQIVHRTTLQPRAKKTVGSNTFMLKTLIKWTIDINVKCKTKNTRKRTKEINNYEGDDDFSVWTQQRWVMK